MTDHEADEALSPGTEDEGQRDSAAKTSYKRCRTNRKVIFVVAGVIAVVGLILFIVGLVLIAKSKSEGEKHPVSREQENDKDKLVDKCSFSSEAKRAGLPQFFKKVDSSYYELHPHIADRMTGIPLEERRKLFQPYNPTPESIKAISDRSQSLLKELNEKDINRKLLLSRERSMIAQADHFLRHYFGRPYENNYFSGYWMLGPGRYCTRTFKGITSIKTQLATMLLLFRPETASELEDNLVFLGRFKMGINQFKENLKSGIRTGMVGSVTVCKEGKQCLEDTYVEIASQKSGRGVIAAFTDLISSFLSKMSAGELAKILEKHGMNATALVEDSVIKNVGSPLADLFEYFEKEHLPHCLPSNVSSGLGTLPVDHVYYNGSRTLERTNNTLMGGDIIMPGKESYRNFLSFSTTQNITPAEVHDMGWKMLHRLYQQAVLIAKTVTKKDKEEEAVTEFKKYLNSSELYFNEDPFPENESNEEAYLKCKSIEAAQMYCPERYKAMMKWLDFSRNVLALIRPKLTGLVYYTGNKTTAPSCPASVVIRFNPLISVQGYSKSTSSCQEPSKINVPFFVDRMGPRFFEYTVSAHEASPGHHMQSQGYIENFRDQCLNVFNFGFLKNPTVTAFSEGWGLYAENPLVAQDTDLYQHRALENYGALKGQIWRALRLIIDTGLHAQNMTREQAIDLFRRYLWDESDIVVNEVSRYQGWPGQATSYMTGQLAIWRMRNETLEKLGAKFKLQDFHYHVLLHGPVPISYLQTYIEEYSNCVLHEEDDHCEEILTITSKREPSGETLVEDEYEHGFLSKLRGFTLEDSYEF